MKIFNFAFLSIILIQSCGNQSEKVDKCVNPSLLLNTNMGDSVVLNLTVSIEENYKFIEKQTKTSLCNTVGQYSAFLKVEKDTFQLNFFTDKMCPESEDNYPVGYLTADFITYDILLNAYNNVLFHGEVISLDDLKTSIYKSLLKADLNNGNRIIHFIFKYDPNSKLKSRYSIFSSSINAYLQFIEHLTAKPICELNESEINSLRKNIYPVFWFKDSKPLPENFNNMDSILKIDDMEAKKN